jgi:nucleoside-diphosphate-sugar epimerase
MRVLVTGSAGLLGRYVVDAVLARGQSVHSVDRRPLERPLPDGSLHSVADLTEWPLLDQAVAEADAIIHLAAIPNLDSHPEDVVFRANVELCARVAFATIRAGRARRFIYASSQTAIGLALAPELVAPDYLPVDEAHPARPREGYGLSKLAGEELCALVSRRLDIPALAIRLPVIWVPENFARHVAKRRNDPVQAAKSNYAYIDARDAGTAFADALRAQWRGFEVVQIGADRPFADEHIRPLVTARYGPVRGIEQMDDERPLYAIDRAAKLLGWRPRYRWSRDGIHATNHDDRVELSPNGNGIAQRRTPGEGGTWAKWQ